MLFENLPYFYTSPAILLVGMTTEAPLVNFLNNFEYTDYQKSLNDLEDKRLTAMCMSISELTLAEDWENEDDAHWASFPAI